MEEDSFLDGLGMSKKDALIVAVPNNEVEHAVKTDAEFKYGKQKETKFWFQLLDSVSGRPYKGTRATRVAISSDTDVDAFCDAVKSEFQNNLSSIDAAELIVYKNKEAFDKRNAQDAKVFILYLITGRAIVILLPS